MKVITDLEVAEKLGSSFFTGKPALVKRRVRAFLKGRVEPVEKREDVWLYRELDILGESQWHSPQQKEKAHPITKSRGRLRDMGAYEKAQALAH